MPQRYPGKDNYWDDKFDMPPQEIDQTYCDEDWSLDRLQEESWMINLERVMKLRCTFDGFMHSWCGLTEQLMKINSIARLISWLS